MCIMHRSEENSQEFTSSVPNSVIIVRGLQNHITEDDLREELQRYKPKGIRLVQGGDTALSRGFAFVEFNSVNEAKEFMEKKRGNLIIQDFCKTSLHYCAKKVDDSEAKQDSDQSKEAKSDQIEKADNLKILNKVNYKDWFCVKCCTQNFKWRSSCHKCLTSREESMLENDSDEVAVNPTRTILLRNLDVFTTEDSVLKVIVAVENTAPIKNIRIGRDPDSEISTGTCYIDMNTVGEAKRLYLSLTTAKPLIDGKKVLISYCKVSAASVTQMIGDKPPIKPDLGKQDSDSNQVPDLNNYTLKDIPQLARYSAMLYATTPQEQSAYIKYYTEYYTDQLKEKNNGTSQEATISSIAKPPVIKDNSSSFVERPSHPTYHPDVSSYIYDESTGYYFDSQSGLYYDAKAKHYYNRKTDEFLVWDPEKQGLSAIKLRDDNKVDLTAKREKIKVKFKDAKSVVKDMERWAKKGLTKHKKNIPQSSTNVPESSSGSCKSDRSADAGYAILNRPLHVRAPLCRPAPTVSSALQNINRSQGYRQRQKQRKLKEEQEKLERERAGTEEKGEEKRQYYRQREMERNLKEEQEKLDRERPRAEENKKRKPGEGCKQRQKRRLLKELQEKLRRAVAEEEKKEMEQAHRQRLNERIHMEEQDKLERERARAKEMEKEKDMVRWSRRESPEKEDIPGYSVDSPEHIYASDRSHRLADTGYSLFNMPAYSDSPLSRSASSLPPILDIIHKASSSCVTFAKAKSVDSEYETIMMESKFYTDWDKLICLLCKRKFQDRDTLVRHQKWSDLHKNNFEVWSAQQSDRHSSIHHQQTYRDRATERRQKVGESTPPHPNRLKERYLQARSETQSSYYETPNEEGIKSDNIGNKMLHKMGWQEGRGLGKKNQGRVSHIETKQRAAGAGLGLKSAGYLQLPGESYKECIKRRMIDRYKDVIEREENKHY